MSAIINDSFKVTSLESFIASLATQSLYLSIGRPQYWDTTDSTMDTNVPVPKNTVDAFSRDWEDMLSLKRINTTDVFSGIFKEVWQANVRYDTYRHDWNGTRVSVYNGPNFSVTTPQSLGDVKFYVVTSNNRMYACLKQSIVNGVVQPSLYSPQTGIAIGTNTGIVKTADGYYWKFIAVTAATDLIKFSSRQYHPIQTLFTAPGAGDLTPQWDNQVYSANFKGGIYVLNVLTSGTGYNGGIAGTRAVTNAVSDAEFKVIGDGSGLQYTVTYGASGSILDIEVTNPGNGYTHATITATAGNGASFDVIFTSMRGLGCVPSHDLVARYLLLSTTLVGPEGSGDFTTSNDFRKISLIYNPTNFGGSTKSTASTLNATLTLNIGTGISAGDYPADSIVTGATSGAKGRIVDFDATTGDIRVIRTSSENSNAVGANLSFLVGETLASVPGSGTATILSIGNPEVAKYSGDILYTEYRAPVSRGPLTTEDVRVIVKF